MELILNVYDENDNIVKTYQRQSYSIRMRLLKTIIDTLQLDTLAKALISNSVESNMKLVELAGMIVNNGYEQVQELMKDIFKGLTDEEFLDTNMNEVVNVIINLGKFAFSTISLASGGGKN